MTTTISITESLSASLLSAAPRGFSTGSVGIFYSGKVVADGRRYQTTLTATVIGSKDDPNAQLPSPSAVGPVVADVVAGLVPHAFKPKDNIERPGYGSYGKVVVDGQRFTYSLNVVPVV